MGCKLGELQSSSDVYEIPGEPAIVIDGLPSLDGCGNSNPPISTGAEAETTAHPVFAEWMIGRAVEKLFRKQIYTGTVTTYDKSAGWFRVVYVDGDFEDLTWHELQEILVPLDITISLKTLASKRLKKNQTCARKTTNAQISSRKRLTRGNAVSEHSGQ